VFFAQPDPPSGWMATFMPPAVRVMALGTGLPESPAWRARQLAAIAERPGPHYLLLSAARNDRDGTRLRKLALAQSLGLTGDAAGCDKLERLMKHVRLQVELRRLPSGGCTSTCCRSTDGPGGAGPRHHRASGGAAAALRPAAGCRKLLHAPGGGRRRAASFLWCRVGMKDRTPAR
jgi:hypothetical protein